MSFAQAFEMVIGHEGGLVDNHADPGGLTKYGISQRSYPGEDIRNLTLERAQGAAAREGVARSCSGVLHAGNLPNARQSTAA